MIWVMLILPANAPSGVSLCIKCKRHTNDHFLTHPGDHLYMPHLPYTFINTIDQKLPEEI